MLISRAAVAAVSFRSVAGRSTVVKTARPVLASLCHQNNNIGGRHQQVSWMSTVDVPPPPTSHHAHTKLPNAQGTIIYTETDEAPALATYSLYPAVNKIAALAGIDVVPCDVSAYAMRHDDCLWLSWKTALF
jgi:Monomeric isocitrate dehydrogenase